MHFGKLLKALYEARGFTQGQLADAAGTSEATIGRGVASEKCPWRRSLAIDVLRALEQRAPLSEGDASNYLQLSGLGLLAEQGGKMLADMRREAQAEGRRVAAAMSAYSTRGQPNETKAHTWLDLMLESADPNRVLNGLQVMAAALGVDLPDVVSPRNVWTRSVVQDPEGGEYEIRKSHQVPSAEPAARPKALPKRRPA